MRLVGRERLDDFTRKHADARKWVSHWVIEVGAAKWTCPQDVTKQYQTASVLPEGKGIIFNVKGNDYRMHVRMNFGLGVVLVVRIGTHKEYMSWTY